MNVGSLPVSRVAAVHVYAGDKRRADNGCVAFSEEQFWADVEHVMHLAPAVRWRGWTDVQVRHVSRAGSPVQRCAALGELQARADDDGD